MISSKQHTSSGSGTNCSAAVHHYKQATLLLLLQERTTITKMIT
jgi:hypothetical protein